MFSILGWTSESPDLNPFQHALYLRQNLKAKWLRNEQKPKNGSITGLTASGKFTEFGNGDNKWVTDLWLPFTASSLQPNTTGDKFIMFICPIIYKKL